MSKTYVVLHVGRYSIYNIKEERKKKRLLSSQSQRLFFLRVSAGHKTCLDPQLTVLYVRLLERLLERRLLERLPHINWGLRFISTRQERARPSTDAMHNPHGNVRFFWNRSIGHRLICQNASARRGARLARLRCQAHLEHHTNEHHQHHCCTDEPQHFPLPQGALDRLPV